MWGLQTKIRLAALVGLGLCWACFIGLLLSRALLSMSMIGLGGWVLAQNCIYQRLFYTRLWRSGLHAWLLIPLLYLVSALCSDNTREGWGFVSSKLPFVLFPFFFLCLQQDRQDWWFCWISKGFIACMLVACGYSLLLYLPHIQQYNLLYARAKVIPVLMEGDHVRFAIALCVAYWLCIMRLYHRQWSWYDLAGALFFFLFAHLLAVRTGLAGIYSITMITGGTAFFRRWRWKGVMALFILLVLIAILLLQSFPSLQQKVNYTRYDWQQYRPGSYRPEFSDGTRRSVNTAAVELWRQHPLMGTGLGDIKRDLALVFARRYQGQLPAFTLPFSQYLFWLDAMGITGLLMVLWLISLPLWKTEIRQSVGLIALFVFLMVSCIAEANLEFQYSIFLFTFFVTMAVSRRGMFR